MPGPKAAMIQPPAAGPARRRAIGRTNWSSELAAGRSDAGRMSGTSASKAGVKNAVPAPYTIARAAISHTWMRPVSESTASTAIAAARTASAASMIARRLSRSLTTPPGSRQTIVGTVMAIPTIESAAGAFQTAYTCHAIATRKMPSPTSDTVIPDHRSRKSRWRSGAKRFSRLKPPGRSRPS